MLSEDESGPEVSKLQQGSYKNTHLGVESMLTIVGQLMEEDLQPSSENDNFTAYNWDTELHSTD